jgi:hypothetical protein
MAKTDKLNTSRPVEDDFDVPDFDFDSLEGKDDRTPVTKLAHGVYEGATSTIKDASFIKKLLRIALPEGYGQAMDFADEVGTTAKQLYNNAAREIKPSIAEMSKAADKLVPTSAPYLKNTLSSINKWADQQKALTQSAASKEDQRTEGLGISLADTFKFQMTHNAKQDARKEVRERLQEGIEIGRHRDVFGMLNRIGNATNRLAQYQDKITINFQRKSLETQMRTQFVMMDLLSETKEQNAFLRTSLDAIQKNTGLPDFVKQTNSERLDMMLRTRMANKLFDSNISKKFGDHITKLAKDKVSLFKDKINEATGALEQAGEAKETLEQVDDKLGLAGNTASSAFITWLAEKLAKGQKDFLGKHKTIAKGNELLKDFVGNAPAKLTEFKNNKQLLYKDNIGSKLISLLQELVPDLSPDTGVKEDKLGDLNKPHIFTKQTHKSINEVIPGYLSRIFRELQVMRTGDENINLTTYDVTKNKFLDAKIAEKNLLNNLVEGNPTDEDLKKHLKKIDPDKKLTKEQIKQASKNYMSSGKNATGRQLDELLEMVDPGGKMSPDARVALGKKLLSQNLDNTNSGIGSVTNKDTFTNDKITEKYADEIHNVMLKFFKVQEHTKVGFGLDNETLSKHNAFTDKQKSVGQYLENPASKIQEMINLGMNDFLSNNDLVNENGNINIEKLLNYAGGVGGMDSADDLVFRSKDDKPGQKKKPRGKNGKNVRVPSFAVGVDKVPHDMFAKIHEGEAILTKEENTTLISEATLMRKLLEKIESTTSLNSQDQSIYFGSLIEMLARGMPGGSGNNSYADLKTDAKDIFSRGNINIVNFLRKTKNATVWVAKKPFETAGIVKDTAKGAFNIAKDFTQPARSFLWNKTKEAYNEISDLYVTGRDGVALRAELLKAGAYIDVNSKKVIEKISDITGEVRDKAGNVILEASELKNLVSRNLLSKTVTGVSNFLGKNVRRISNLGNLVIPPILKLGFDTAKFIINKAKNILNEPVDIYVKGIENPVMTALIMRNGGYFRASDNGPVMRPSDIDGVIKNSTGEVVLTTEQIKMGLVDSKGDPIRLPIQKILAMVKNTIISGLKFTRGIGTVVKNVVKGAANLITRGVNGIDIGGYGQASVNVLTQIYTVLNDRLPGKKKQAFNDTDGDGVREGSWRKQQKGFGTKGKSVAEGAKKADEAVKKSEKEGGLLSGLMDTLTDLFDIGDGSKKKGGKGWLRKGASALKSVGTSLAGMRLFGMGAGALATGAATASAGTIAAGATGGGAAAATGATAAATAATGSTLGATIVAGLAGTLTTIGAILTSPITLGLVAAAALSYGGYKAYKYLKAKVSPLVAFRMVQYGYRQDDNSGIQKILELEDMLKKITMVKAGRASLSDKNFDMEKALSLFNVSKDDSSALNNWTAWFTNRFKPVYLTHYTAIAALDNKTPLAEVDDFKPAIKVKYLELVHFPEGPYDSEYRPDITSDVKVTNGADVEAAFKVAKAAADRDLKQKKDSTRLGVATAAQLGEDVVNKLNQKNTNSTAKNTKADGLGDAATAASEARNISAKGSAPRYRKAGTIEALEGARFRAYGLHKMETMKVNCLRQLEDLITDNSIYGADGKASLKADANIIIDSIGGVFGVSRNTDKGEDWINWFQKRFLPVYLTYLGLVKQMSGSELVKGKLPQLKPSQELTIVNQLVSLPGIWGVTSSPWDGYSLGSNSSILKDILESLQEDAKNELAAEAIKKKLTPQTSDAGKVKPSTDTSPRARGNNPSAYESGKPQGGPDSESSSLGAKGSGGFDTTSGAAPNGLVLAGGAISDGRNASQFTKLKPGVNIDNLNPAFKANLNGMIEEFGKLTGKTVYINDGFRTFAQQQQLYAADSSKAAKPGTSMHESGLAVDINSATLDEMEKLGLMRKYGFTRPVGGEKWHMEPAGIQTDIQGFKQNPQAATKAIQASLGKGGGGLGTVAGSKLATRDPVLAKKLLDMNVTPSAVAKAESPAITDNSKVLTAIDKSAKAGNAGTMIDITKKTIPDKPQVKSDGPSGLAGITSSADSESGKGMMSTSSRAPAPGDKMEALKSSTPGTGGKYSLLGEGSSAKGWESQKDVILGASKMTGVDPKILAPVIAIESGFNPNARAGSSTASGLGQFVDKTWEDMIRKNGSKYGITPGTSPMDSRANALMTAEYIKENMKSLSGSKSDLNATDLYMAHFLGAAGAKKFFSADPNTVAANVLPDAAKSNPGIFYNGNTPRTISEVYSLLDGRVKNKVKEHGVPVEYHPVGGIGLKPGSSLEGVKPGVPGSSGLGLKAPNSTASTIAGMPSQSSSTNTPSSSQPDRNISAALTPRADVGGFNVPTTKQVQSNPNADMTNAIGDVSTTLKKSLDVQTSMLSVLQKLLENSGQPKAMKVDEKNTPSNNDMNTSNVQGAQPQRTPNKTVPVSMART